MASSRTIQAPGVELQEFDRSSYKVDTSLYNAPKTLICGFANNGIDYTPLWINSKNTFLNTFGAPTTEFEKYFYNAALEILDKGGTVYAAKLPYDNASKDMYTYTTYQMSCFNVNNIDTIDDTEKNKIMYDVGLQQLSGELKLPGESSGVQINATNILSIWPTAVDSGLINAEKFDELETGDRMFSKMSNKLALQNLYFTIVDISRTRYNTVDFDCIKSILTDDENGSYTEQTNDCLGILPVIVTPYNALFFQQIFNLSGTCDDFNSISSFDILHNNDLTADLNVLSDKFELLFGDNSTTLSEIGSYMNNIDPHIDDETISQRIANYFPSITYKTQTLPDKRYFKYIGVAVFKMYKDQANNGNINFAMPEFFVGSLDPTMKNPINNASEYIEDVINQQSKYIRFYTNVKKKDIANVDLVMAKNMTCKALGFHANECAKHISTQNSILAPLTRVLENVKDPNIIELDIVCDAGISNIAAKTKMFETSNLRNYPDWKQVTFKNTESVIAWQTVLRKFDTFCKSTRKDCMFIADVYRAFCLEGEKPIVRLTNKKTIKDDILPNIKYISNVINSSYSCGYTDWFLTIDEYTGDDLWLPPSIKAAGIFTYCDTYFKPWDAPAGLTRGIINAIDCAFTPTNEEAGKIYNKCWNYAINYPINGIVLEGQKTFQTEKTALDRINVRRCMLYLEKKTKQIARRFLYEGNTYYTRQRLVDKLTVIFQDCKDNFGIQDYIIKCDDDNNPIQAIENNELHIAIAIKPVKAIEFIVISFIVTNQSASVVEEVEK